MNVKCLGTIITPIRAGEVMKEAAVVEEEEAAVGAEEVAVVRRIWPLWRKH